MSFKYSWQVFLSISLALLPGCAADEDNIPLHTEAKPTIPTPAQKYDYHIYLENSGSMNGYLNVSGDSNFKSNVYGFITMISGFPEKQRLDLYDINSRIIPAALNAGATEVNNYITTLNETTFKIRSKANNASQGASDLCNVIQKVLDTTGINDVRALITDGIFSPGKSRDAIDYLGQQKNGIHGFINEKLRAQNFATLVLQFYSDFKGRYYYQDDSYKNNLYQKRPYYIICFGPETELHHILEQVQKNGIFEGFANFLFLTPTSSYNVAPRICNYTEYYEYDLEKPMTVTNTGKGGKDNRFRIKLGLDYTVLPLSIADLQDHKNYAVSQGYSIESIRPATQNGYTHELILLASAPRKGTVKLSLKRQLPRWVITSNTDADKGLTAADLSRKTFGIRYLLEGIYDAYTTLQSTEYFSISISVKE